MKKSTTIAALMLAFMAFESSSIAQPGSLDNTFDTDGKVTTPFGNSNDYGYSTAIQSDGKIVVAGYSYNGTNDVFAVVRYNTDGSLDNTFDADGKVTTPVGSFGDYGTSVAIQSDSKIVVAGSSLIGTNIDFDVVRYNTNGSLDTTFDADGKVTTPVGSSNDYGYSVAIQSDGKIVVAGYSYNGANYDFAVVRYNTDGSLDTTFDADGKVITPVGSSSDWGYSVAIQSDGKIVVAGFSSNGTDDDFAVVRYNADGSLDNTFDANGKVTTPVGSFGDFGYSVAIQSDGKIVVAGSSNNGTNKDFAVVCYNTNGSLDTTFDTDGKVTTPVGDSTDYGYSVAIQSDGKIVVAGYIYNVADNDFAAVRYNANGSLDTTFDADGKVTTPVGSSLDVGYSVAIQSDGKIVVAGSIYNVAGNDFAVVRYNNICSAILFSQSPAICQGNSVTVGSNTYTTDGTYYDTLNAFNGCDSVITTMLIVLPNNSFTQSLTINSGNSVQVGSSIYTTSGTYIDTIVATNGCDSIVTTNLTVLIGIKEVISNEMMSIYPNPTTGVITIQMRVLKTGNLFLDIFNMLGEKIYSSKIKTEKMEIDLSNQPNGIYFIQLISDNGISFHKMLLNK